MHSNYGHRQQTAIAYFEGLKEVNYITIIN